MHYHLVFVGKTIFPEAQKGIQRYIGRLRHYAQVTEHVVRGARIGPRSNPQRIKEDDSARILRLVKTGGSLILWDQRGTQMDSPGLARFLARYAARGKPHLWLAVGGPLGFSPELFQRADHVLSLSLMTFPHDLARLLVVEQLYRAHTILRGEPYHK